MPASSGGNRRKCRASCEFCVARKLRCDRPLPCTNCVSRGRTCQLKAKTPAATLGGRARQELNTSFPTPLSPNESGLPANLAAEVRELKQRTQDVERRMYPSMAPDHEDGQQEQPEDRRQSAFQTHESSARLQLEHQNIGHGGIPTTHSSMLPSPETLLSLAPDNDARDVVSHLEEVSRGYNTTYMPAPSRGIALDVERIGAISRPDSVTQQITLPQFAETIKLVNCYMQDLSYIQQVVHPPTLSAMVDDIYRRLRNKQSVEPGRLVLLLSVIAMATHVWTGPTTSRGNNNSWDYHFPPHNGFNTHDRAAGDKCASLFTSIEQARAQTSMWIQATLDALNQAQDNTSPTLEMIQGILTLSFLLSNLEGVSLQYRFLVYRGIFLARELGLHQVDNRRSSISIGLRSDPIKAELGRRACWYLAATDWLLAARYGGPGEGIYQAHLHQMEANKPRNINDADLLLDANSPGWPPTQLTDMSYFLHRIRLAEICRDAVDKRTMGMTQSSQDHAEQVMAIDSDLGKLLHDLPPFFNLDNYHEHTAGDYGHNAFIQAYMLNTLIHSQRCKLHLSTFSSHQQDSPTYSTSRSRSLESAKSIIRAELMLIRSDHPFVNIRLRLTGMLYSVFMASIVLLMDLCLHHPASLETELQQGDVAEALHIIGNAKSSSLAAGRLYESMMQIVANYQGQRQSSAPDASQVLTDFTPESIDVDGMSSTQRNSTMASSEETPQPATVEQDGHMFDDYLQQWDDLFTDLQSSSFF